MSTTDRLDYRERKTLVVYPHDPREPHDRVSRHETVHLGDLDEGMQEGVPQQGTRTAQSHAERFRLH